MSIYDVIFDSNEAWQNVWLVNELKKAGFKVGKQNMPAGDIYFEGKKRILVERKTSKDFANSVVSGRLWNQLKKMKVKKEELDCDLILLIEGSWARVVKRTKWSRASIMGIVDGIRDPSGWDIEVFGPLPSRVWTSLWIKSRVKKSSKISEKTLRSLRRPIPDILTPDEKKRYIMEGLEKVGPMTADRLLREYGSVTNALINIKDWAKVKGVGPSVVKANEEIITGRYKARVK